MPITPVQPIDKNTRQRALLIILLFIALWTLFPTFAQHNLDPFFDMVENYAWGIAWQWGYSKHPPLFAWITAAWFEYLPHQNWIYYLLAALNLGFGMGVMWRVSMRFLTQNQQLIALACWFFIPTLTFLGLTYNANSAMIPFWALSLLFYLRMFERRKILDAILFGVFCGLSMLIKYYSAVLLLAFFIHITADKKAREIWKTPLPFIAFFVFSLTFLPHIYWLINNDFLPIQYAANEQGNSDFASLLSAAIEFAIAAFLYALPGLVLFSFMRRLNDNHPLFAFTQIVHLKNSFQGRAFLYVATLPFILTLLLSFAASSQLTTTWVIPCFITMPVILTLLLPEKLTQKGASSLPYILAGLTALLLSITPLYYHFSIKYPKANAAVPYVEIVEKIQKEWSTQNNNPLRFIDGSLDLAAATSFYSKDNPHALQRSNLKFTPWISKAQIDEHGVIIACHENREPDCLIDGKKLIGEADITKTIIVPAVSGAGGPSEWRVNLLFKNAK